MDDRNVIDEFTKNYHKAEDPRVGQQTRLDQQTQLRQARLRRAQSRQAQYRSRVAQTSPAMAAGQGQFGPAGPQVPQPDGQFQPDGRQPDQFQESPQSSQKSHKCHKGIIGLISLIIGIVIGGAGMYALNYFLAKPAECPECDCAQPAPATSLNNLDYDFFKLEAADSNIIYSPLSIKNGLALLDAGAAGTTKAEIDKVLGDTEIPKYENIADNLSLANAVFIRDTFQDSVLPTYTSTVTNDYNAEVMYDSFESSTNMDNWVSQKTFGLIDSIGLTPTPDTEMVLANALAIQMDWQYGFDTSDTHGATFYTQDGTEIEATTMANTFNNSDVQYNVTDDATVVTLPLNSGDTTELEFDAIMPTGDIDEYLSKLDTTTVETALSGLTPASTNQDGLELLIPKFKFDYSLNFKSDLESLGITQAFTSNADFSNMASADLYVSDAVHKANIDFSENGIKAAAVTALMMTDNAVAMEEPQPTVIKIDRPFVFLIRDKANGAIWFAGAVYQPNLWADDAANYQ